MSETKTSEIGPYEQDESTGVEPSPPLIQGAQQRKTTVGADGKPMVTDPDKAGETEQTGSWGTGTPGGSNVAGLQEPAPIESAVKAECGRAPKEQTADKDGSTDAWPNDEDKSIDDGGGETNG